MNRWHYTIPENGISIHIIRVYPKLLHYSSEYKSELLELLVKDVETNFKEEHLTEVRELCIEELERQNHSTGVDRNNIIRTIRALSDHNVEFPPRTCEVIGKLIRFGCHYQLTPPVIEKGLLDQDKECTVSGLCSLIKNFKFGVNQKTIEELCEIIICEKHGDSTRLPAFKCLVFSIRVNKFVFSVKVRKAFMMVMDENKEAFTGFVFEGLEMVSPTRSPRTWRIGWAAGERTTICRNGAC